MSTGTAILYSVHVKLKTQINSRKKKERFPFTVEVALTQKKKIVDLVVTIEQILKLT